MKIEDFSVTKLKGAVNDPEILKKARTMYPDLQNVFKTDMKKYYTHYQNFGHAEGRKGSY